ncbi:hypothetical protein CQA81_31755, partial [Klebsiella pneumoniae]
ERRAKKAGARGEGEPPEEAVALHKFLFSKKAPKMVKDVGERRAKKAGARGEGEPPEEAVALHKFLFSKKAPK